MNPILKKLTYAMATSAITFTLAGAVANFAALAQVTAPSAIAPLPAATIKALQEALSKQGFAVKADGVLGDDTRAALRQYQSQHHLPVTGDPDKATLDKLGVAEQGSGLPSGSPPGAPGQAMAGAGTGAQGTMGMGMGMMTPEMMQRMQRMMGQGGMVGMMGAMQGEGMPKGGMGPGMMGQMPTVGGMPMCPMMRMMMGSQPGMGMPGMTGMMGSHATLLGTPLGSPAEMTEEKVRALLEQQLAGLGNPRLRLGAVGRSSDGSINAEIVTIDGSLVQKLAFNRYPGLVRQLD